MKRFICAWAQNNTPVHPKLWENLEAYAGHIGARVLVQGGAYNPGYNPFDHNVEPDPAVSWAPEVEPYLAHDNVRIGNGVWFFAGVPIRATATKPLTGMQGFGHTASGIFGHPKWHLECHAVAGAVYPKLQQTTGAVTWDNYSKSKAGAKARFHHMLGFAVVETQGKYYHLRRVSADAKTGEFYDTCAGQVWHVSGGKVTEYTGPTAALMVGDSHAEEQCVLAIKATQDQIRILKPERILGNDVYSHAGASHHQRGKHLTNFKLHHSGVTDVAVNLRIARQLIQRIGFTDILDSNHHDHLTLWLDDPAGHSDPENSEIWHKLNFLMRRDGLRGGALEAAIGQDLPHPIRWHRRSGDCVINGVAFVHGHEGANGARGIASHGDRLGTKIVSAHTHTPRGLGGFDTVGHTSQPQHGYNNSHLSAWLQGNLVMYPNGKRQHLHIIRDAKCFWRTSTLA